MADLEEFKPMVENIWRETQLIFLSTSSLFRFSKKLKALKPLIKSLAKNMVGNLTKKALEAFKVLCEKQEANHMNPSQSSLEEESDAYRRWDLVSKLEENFLKQRSNVHWLKVGDRNNKSFHRVVVACEANNSIKEIQCSDGRMVSKAEEIKSEAENFFRCFLQYVPSYFVGISTEELEEIISNRCAEQDKTHLIKEVTEE